MQCPWIFSDMSETCLVFIAFGRGQYIKVADESFLRIASFWGGILKSYFRAWALNETVSVISSGRWGDISPRLSFLAQDYLYPCGTASSDYFEFFLYPLGLLYDSDRANFCHGQFSSFGETRVHAIYCCI